jgi:hypothetical protein
MREERDPIDRAIDDTAQAMTAAPPPNLRAPVADRIASRPRRGWFVAWPATAAAAAALVLAMLLWPQSRLKPAPTTAEQPVGRTF